MQKTKTGSRIFYRNLIIQIQNLEKCKNHTIDKILEKDDLELALEFLTGELQLPK